MAKSNLDFYFTIGSSVTALSTTLQTFTGQTIDQKGGTPRQGYDLTVRVGSVYTGAVNTAATAVTSAVTFNAIADLSDSSTFASTIQSVALPNLVVNFPIQRSSTVSVTSGQQAVQVLSTQARYARLRIVNPSAPGNTTTMITTVIEALLGQSSPV